MTSPDQTKIEEQIEDAIVTALKAHAWLGTVAGNVITVEAGIREKAITGDLVSEGFSYAELPAIMVTCGLDAPTVEDFTKCEFDISIPVQIVAVCRATTLDEARSSILEVKNRTEQFLRNQNSSANELGINGALVRLASGSIDLQTDNAGFWYGVAIVSATVQVNVPIT